MTRAAAGASPARSGLAPSGCTCQKLRISVKRTRCADFCGNPSRTKGKLKILKKAEKERRRQASDEEAAAAAVTDDVDLGRYAHAIRSRKAGTPDIPLENQVAAEACRQGLQAGHGLYQALSTNPQLQAQLSEVLKDGISKEEVEEVRKSFEDMGIDLEEMFKSVDEMEASGMSDSLGAEGTAFFKTLRKILDTAK